MTTTPSTTVLCGRPTNSGRPCRVRTTDGRPCKRHTPDELRTRREQAPQHMPGCTEQKQPGWGRPVASLCLGDAGHLVEYVCIGCSISTVWHLARESDEVAS